MKSGIVRLKLKRGRKKRPLETFTGSFSAIVERVKEYYQVDPTDLNNKKRPAAFARQVAMYLMYTFTDAPTKDIGTLMMGTPDHALVMYANKQIRGFCRFDPEIRKQIIDIETMLE